MILDEENEGRAEAYRVLAGLFSKPPDAAELDALREDLELETRETEFQVFDDFAHLFAIPGGVAPPLESLAAAGGETDLADVLTDFYADAGLTFDEQYELMPDHLSLELLFMSYLIDSRDLELQERFLEEHIMNWVPYYCDRVTAEARTLFYREVASLTRDFLEREYADFD